MDYFESNFKDRQNEIPKDLPKGFEWDAMKDDIEAKMDAQRPKRPNRWWPFLLLLLISGCGGWLAISFFDNQTEPQAIQNVINEQNSSTLGEETPENINEKPLKNTSSDRTVTANVSSEKNVRTNSQKGADDPLVSQNKRTFEPLSKKENGLNDKKTLKVLKTPGTQVIKKPALESNSTTELTNANDNRERKANVTALAALPIVSNPLENTKQFELPFIPQPLTNPSLSDKHLSLAILGGANNWNNNIRAANNEPFISGFPGFSIRPEIQLKKNKWLFSFAYQYDRLQEKFEYAGSTTVQELKEDVLVGEVVNSLTGEVIEHTLKDTMVDVTYTQRELKYNTYNLHQLEFGVARQLLVKRQHELYVRGGLTYLFLFNGSGKRLNEQRLVDDFKVENTLGQSSDFALSFGLDYTYRISPKTSVMVRFNGRQYLTAIDITATETIRPFIYGIQLGVQRRF